METSPTLSGIFFLEICGFSQNSGGSLLVDFCVTPMRASAKTTQGNYISVFGGVSLGFGFAHSRMCFKHRPENVSVAPSSWSRFV